MSDERPYGQKLRRIPGLYEQATNRQQRRLTRAYDTWAARTKRGIAAAQRKGQGIPAQYGVLEKAMPELERKMLALSNAGLERAARLGAGDRSKSAIVERTLTRQIALNESLVSRSLIPNIWKRLTEKLATGLDYKGLGEAFGAMRVAPAQYAGGYWVMIFETQKELGKQEDLEAIARGEKPAPVRWVLDPLAVHCEPRAGYYGCPELEGEYPSWHDLPTVPASQVSCLGNCRCRLESWNGASWQRGLAD